MSDVYAPPLEHTRFLLEHLLPSSDRIDVDTFIQLLDEVGRFCVTELAPLNRVGDQNGVGFDPASGTIRTAPGWQDAYRKYLEAGWSSVSFDPEYGGGGLPWLFATALHEVMTAANMAFGLAPMLTNGAVEMLAAHGTEQQRNRWLPQLVSGQWTGTMNLTEPQAGSDVGSVTTRAQPTGDPDLPWRITGTKIFITYGEHDLTDNIVHLVLARTPQAPPGTRGISCFIVPKVLPDGRRNAVRCIGVEHKMGIHASPTCTLEYDGAVGWLVGDEENVGMTQMFTMMNRARLAVGVSGLSLADRSRQAALAYSRERVQGRAEGARPGSSSLIIEHPDVRRALLHMTAHVEAMRALAYTNASEIDAGTGSSALVDGCRADEVVALLTPITKAWCTDLGSELTRMGTQVFGGMGYIAETGIEQHERDVRIAAIYEGTNGIQAIDLVQRKLPTRDGHVVHKVLDAIESTADGTPGEIGSNLAQAVGALRGATEWMLVKGADDRRSALAGATPYLRMFGTVLGGWFLARQAAAAAGYPHFAASAEYYCRQVLPTAEGLLPAVTAGHQVLDAVADITR